MGIEFTLHERSALYGLLAESTSDIVVRTDRRGFIDHASPTLAHLGLDPRDMLIPPHVLDLADPAFVPALRAALDLAIAGRPTREWVEFSTCGVRGSEGRWFEAHFRTLGDASGRPYGALGVIRSIEARKSLEERLFAAEMTDVLTGLTNRRAFTLMLAHLVEHRAHGCLALIASDNLRALNLRHGHSAGDAVLAELAALLRTLLRAEDIVSRIGGETFAALLPHTNEAAAGEIAQRILEGLAEINGAGINRAGDDIALTLSIGVASIGGTLDETLKRAELAAFLAKAKGGNRVERDGGRLLHPG